MAGIKRGLVAAGAFCTCCVFSAAVEKPPVQTAPDRSPTQRPQKSPAPVSRPPDQQVGPAQYPGEFRRLDGWWNNPRHGDWGGAGTVLLRLMPPEYGDGIGNVPAGQDRPAARAISNLVSAQTEDMPNAYGLTDFVWQWGQFLDHDIVETPVASPAEAFDIPVPQGDAWFDPNGTGTQVIPLDRSGYLMVEGVRQQVNHITSFIDASNVYGSERSRTNALREHGASGRMKVSAGNLLPYNVNGLPNAPDPNDPTMFLAGDIRANEQNGLTAMHTLFVREHNYWADRIQTAEPSLTGKQVFAYARALVGAEIQAITYNEFLPALLGRNSLPRYQGYKANVNPGVSNFFATCAYRMGHSMLSPTLLRLDANGFVIPEGNLPLEEAFFRPDLIRAHGIEPLLRGLTARPAQSIDPYVIDAARNMLFGPPGSGGFDLAALNIQRGRDHGMPSYNDARLCFGLDQVQTFDEISNDPALIQRLEAAYGTVDKVDAWVGFLAETPIDGSVVGQCLYYALRDQFTRLRDGDRFWYESYLGPDLARFIDRQTLATIIRRNTDIGAEIPDDVFHVRR